MENYAELLKMLMEIGFVAKDNGFLVEAEKIFEGVSKCRPYCAYPVIGIATVAMNRGQFKKAVDILHCAPIQDSMEKQLRDSFLGKALKLAGYIESAREILNDIIKNGTYDVAINMARDILPKE